MKKSILLVVLHLHCLQLTLANGIATIHAIANPFQGGTSTCRCPAQALDQSWLHAVHPTVVQQENFLKRKRVRHLDVDMTLLEFRQPHRLSALELPFKLLTVRSVDTSGIIIESVPTEQAVDSWFPGYAWSVLLCGACNNRHIGWMFTSSRNPPDSFYALIVEEDLDAQERQLRTQEEQFRKQERASQDNSKQDYAVPEFLRSSFYFINIAVTGETGAGKSSLINAIRGVKRGHATWAPVGVTETTMSPEMYEFPEEPRARLWDLPGAGTPAWPIKTYVRSVGLRHFDVVLIVSASRFREVDVVLMEELRHHNVPFFAVRQKVNLDIEANEEETGIGEEDTKADIANDLRKRDISNPYLISSRKVTSHDFPKLVRDVHAAIVANRKHSKEEM